MTTTTFRVSRRRFLRTATATAAATGLPLWFLDREQGQAHAATSEWTMGDPIVTYWAGPGYDGMVPFTDAVARQMVELGINLVWTGTAAEVDLAGREGLRALYQTRTILLPTG